ncbi:DUF2849 domain-containing protein [Kozakia baliensis]|uniref:DUF2849 domain-containing protein n=1 Tax=Kozakia baliensis TaxID=153496 RepID=UPI0004953933|nr:DUF2849 domain-containing protein [Kozakia baliensis]
MKRPTRIDAEEKLVLTANRLLDGHIVWLDQEGRWRSSIAHAAMFEPDTIDAALEKAKAHAQLDEVVGIYDVVVRPGPPLRPVSVRENIRAFGPTVHPQFSKEIER